MKIQPNYTITNIQKNKNSKLLFLSDTTIANLFLDIALFDLVII